MLLANFNLVNACAPQVLCTIMHMRARIFSEINFGNLVKKVRQLAELKSPKSFRLYGM